MNAPRSPAKIRWKVPNPMLLCPTWLKEFPTEDRPPGSQATVGTSPRDIAVWAKNTWLRADHVCARRSLPGPLIAAPGSGQVYAVKNFGQQAVSVAKIVVLTIIRRSFQEPDSSQRRPNKSVQSFSRVGCMGIGPHTTASWLRRSTQSSSRSSDLPVSKKRNLRSRGDNVTIWASTAVSQRAAPPFRSRCLASIMSRLNIAVLSRWTDQLARGPRCPVSLNRKGNALYAADHRFD
jgi:hypothetical protein